MSNQYRGKIKVFRILAYIFVALGFLGTVKILVPILLPSASEALRSIALMFFAFLSLFLGTKIAASISVALDMILGFSFFWFFPAYAFDKGVSRLESLAKNPNLVSEKRTPFFHMSRSMKILIGSIATLLIVIVALYYQGRGQEQVGVTENIVKDCSTYVEEIENHLAPVFSNVEKLIMVSDGLYGEALNRCVVATDVFGILKGVTVDIKIISDTRDKNIIAEYSKLGDTLISDLTLKEFLVLKRQIIYDLK